MVIGVLVAVICAGWLAKAVVPDQPEHSASSAAAPGQPAPPGPPARAQGAAAGAADVPGGNAIVAAARIGGRVREGDTLTFDVVLRSSGLLLLHPCPAYTITFGTWTTSGRLSCGGVPYLVSLARPDGTVSAFRPALPAGTDVVFRMKVRVPRGTGRRRVTWALLDPRSTVVSGTVTVARSGS